MVILVYSSLENQLLYRCLSPRHVLANDGSGGSIPLSEPLPSLRQVGPLVYLIFLSDLLSSPRQTSICATLPPGFALFADARSLPCVHFV